MRYAVGRVWAALPTGRSLTRREWGRRHRAIQYLLWAHVLVLPIYGLARGEHLEHALLETSIIATAAALASLRGLSQTVRSVMATLGLVTASAILTHFSGGLIEMHFHFFVVVAVVSLYQSWVPFLAALGYVITHHGVFGQLAPESVFNHEAALQDPWIWALIHGGFILALSGALLILWRLNEVALDSERGARHAMEKAHSDLAAAQAISSLGSWDWPIGGRDVWWSEELYRIFGRESETFEPTLESFLAHVATDDRERVAGLIERALSERGELDYECTIVRPDGTTRVIHALASVQAGASGPNNLMGTCQDITERKQLEAEVAHRAFHDGLTGLANRALFLDRLEHSLALARRSQSATALLYLDLDGFKTVNDNLGHEVGDELLVEVAKRLRAAVRTSDTVARLGGDEFAILLDGAGADGAVRVADDVLKALHEPLAVAGTRLLARASVGVAVADIGDQPGDLLRHADIAMYAAKRQGQHSHRVFNEGMHSSLTARMELEAELAEAIELEQFIVHYQPLIDLHTGQIDGVEALVRWDHPLRGVLPPSEFISVAEEVGLINELGAWVLGKATRDARALQTILGRSLYISVNVAAPQLQTDIAATVIDALAAAQLDPTHLLLEITETCLMSQEAAVVDKLTALRAMGVRIAIDDFGTGYSSLAYLRQLPIDHLKIDRSFVRDIADGPEESALAHSIIKLGSLFGLRVVGEGIETDDQARILRELGCHTGQGYLYYRPTDLESLIKAMTAPTREAAAVT